jgi:hypothetical protein
MRQYSLIGIRELSPFPFIISIGFTLIILILGACGQVENQMERLDTLDQGINSGITTKRLEAIRDQAAWENFWKAHAGASSEVPTVNFFAETVIVVHLGLQPLDPRMEIGAEITHVENEEDNLVIHYNKVIPFSGCIAQNLVGKEPFHIIKIRRNDTKAEFIEGERHHSCI